MAPPITNHVNVTVNVNAAILPQRFQFGTPNEIVTGKQ